MNTPRFSNTHLPPHLREVCTILALGLIRLGKRTQQSSQVSDGPGESSLHFPPDQSGHAKPNRRPV
jgi:hypothetical protein